MSASANLFLIGAPKAGTTSLASWLGFHPDVFWSTPKEPFYWAADFPRQREHHGFGSFERYSRLYESPAAQAARWRGDGSTTYLYSSRAIPDILASSSGPTKFLVSVRNPADLVVSYHRTQLIALNESEESFSAAWHRSLHHEPDPNSKPLDPKLLDYPLMGKQGAALRRVSELVPKGDLHVVVFDDIKADPDSAWEELTDFLEIASTPKPDFGAENQSNTTARWPAIRRLAHRPPRLLSGPVSLARRAISHSQSPLARTLRARLWKEAARPSVDPALKHELNEYFAQDVAELERLLGRELDWTK